ncbi:MAG TPA: LpqB family beta-propeller domain-containing protein [Longimicrobium sp.]|nr:LpqB family beta-propeller domain-containing protein [Longimicrobium sp.]
MTTDSVQPRTPSGAALTGIPCTANVRTGTVTCSGSPGDAVARGARANRIIGGQRVYVLVQSGNVQYDSVAQVLSTDVTVQNLLVQRMGSDGAAVTGVKVFFASGPVTTAGTGEVTVANPDGYGLFTASSQPYFSYDGALAPQAVSAARRWEFSVPTSVVTFAFTLYVETPLVPTIVFDMAVSGNRDVYRMGIDGNDLVKLTTGALSDAMPTVAQGTVVFVSYRDGNPELYSVPLKGGAETRLTTTTTRNETSPALSPDGRRLAWVIPGAGGNTKVWAGNANATSGTAAVSPADADGIESSPNWADSTRLAFGAASASSSDIYGLTLNGTPPLAGGVPTLLAGGERAEVEPAWSPDGTKVAFASNRTGDTELYILTVSTGAVTRVTTRAGSDATPSWLKDGRIVYSCIQGAQFRLCVVDPANPAGASIIPTPFQAQHAAAVRF